MNKLLFQIQFLHSYFCNGVFQNCEVVADGCTKNIIDRYRLLARMSDGVFGLYATCQVGAVALLEYLVDQLRGEPLRFLLATNVEKFVSITEFSLDWLGQVSLSSRSAIQEKIGDDTNFQLKSELSIRSISQPNVIGVISIHLDDLLAVGGNNIRYIVEFKARATHWVYYLINRSQTKLNSPIIRNKDNYFFEGPEPVVLSNGEKCLSFNSGATLFPLEQVPSKIFDLVDRLPASMHTEFQPIEHCLIQGLPTPNEGQFSVRQNDTNQYICSVMYIYL